MVDRVSIAIIVGGNLPAAMRGILLSAIQSEGLALDYDGGPFTNADFADDGALPLFAHEVAWARAEIAPFQALVVQRWGRFGSEPVVHTGKGAARHFVTTESDTVMIERQIAERPGSLDAIMAYFAQADFDVPSLRFLP